MNEKELINEISGLDEANIPKSFVGIFHEIWNSEGVVRQVSENIFFKPGVDIFHHLKYLQIDFKFKSPTDQDLAVMWRVLENYCKSGNSCDENSGEYPLLTVNIAPKKYDGKYYLLATNPIIHTLQPNNANSEPTVIRMVFSDEDCLFLQSGEASGNAKPLADNTEEE